MERMQCTMGWIWICADVCEICMTHSHSMRWRRTPNGTPVTLHLPSKDMENMMFNIWLQSNQLWQPICKKNQKNPTTQSHSNYAFEFPQGSKGFRSFSLTSAGIVYPASMCESDRKSKTRVSLGTKKPQVLPKMAGLQIWKVLLSCPIIEKI